MTDEELLGKAIELWKTLPHCCGYPDCDGDLVDMDHSEKCPMFTNQFEPDRFQFAVMFAKHIMQS